MQDQRRGMVRRTIRGILGGTIAIASVYAALPAHSAEPVKPGAQAPAKPADVAKQPAVVKPKPSNQTADITDKQVLDAINKGVEYLLSHKKKDNWESKYDENGKALAKDKDGKDLGWPGRNYGGETSIVLYALLHVGQSVDDQRLNYKSPELAPAIKWLTDLDPAATYTAGLHANALALVPKRPETDDALGRARDYILTAMGNTGGYAYTRSIDGGWESAVPVDFEEQWHIYFLLKNNGGKAKEVTDAKTRLDMLAKRSMKSFGGMELVGRTAANRIKDRMKDDIVKVGEAKAQERAKVEQAELEKYIKEMMSKGTPPTDFQRGLNDAKKKYENALLEQKKGPTTGDATKKAKTAKDLQDDVDTAKREVESAETELKTKVDIIGDLSNGQYGTLGAWALEDAGIELPLAYWQVSDRYWRITQLKDGMWKYNPGHAPSDTMSLAGIASLFITSEFTDTEVRMEPRPDKNIELGLAWLNANYKPTNNDMYYMYGVERIGLASGMKFFGKTNWYKEGAKTLVKTQSSQGSWNYHQSEFVGTAYALLYLSRGRNPVVFNKLEHNGPWNARPRDSANLTHWMSKKFERPINWQTVNLQVSGEEWLDAPVLLITGARDPKFTSDDVAKLKAYINAGGMIFSTADGSSQEFTNAMKKYAAQVAENKYELRELPREHFIFDPKLMYEVKNPPRMLGLSNGIRDVWIHSTVDMGASWQRRAVATREHFEIPANLYFYATGKGSLRSKLQALTVADTKNPPARTINLARVTYAGNCDPEPGAWARLAKMAAVDFKTTVKVTQVPIGKLDPKVTPIAHMTGTNAFTINPDDVSAVKSFVEGGGTLFMDSGGGNPEFTRALVDLVKQAYPDQALEPLPQDHVIYTGKMADGDDATTVEYRKYATLKIGRSSQGRLLGIKVNGRYAIIVSPEDITSGLLGTNTWGIIGYTPDSAASLAQNILLYAVTPQAAAGGATGAPSTAPEATAAK